MHRLARHLAACAEEAGVTIHRGVRVSAIRPHEQSSATPQWRLEGVGGKAALHDTPEAIAAAATHNTLAEADVVLVTDASCSFSGWHRASAGVAEAAPLLARAVQSRARVALFGVMVAFEKATGVPDDALVVDDGGPLWYAMRSESKPGLNAGAAHECWTLLSTPAFAVQEISGTTMQDPVTGAFRPQENGYLTAEGGPSLAVLHAFQAAVLAKYGIETPRCFFWQGQRWGSAFPAPRGASYSVHAAEGQFSVCEEEGNALRREVLGVQYQVNLPTLSQSALPDTDMQDFFMDQVQGIYYASDFTSPRAPGVEASVLAGRNAARFIASQYR